MASILKVDQINDRTNNNKAIEVNSSGVPLLMNVPHLSVGFNGQSTAVTTGDNIFDTSETGTHLIDSSHDITIASDGDITINTSGIYSISLYSISSTRYCYFQIKLNGTDVIRPYVNAATDSNFSWVTSSGAAILSLDANDVITVVAGADQTIHGDHHTRFTAHMIGGK